MTQQFLVTAHPVVITTYQLQYVIRAETKEEAEAIFRNPERYPGKLQLVAQDRQTTSANRQTLPVVIENLSPQPEQPHQIEGLGSVGDLAE